MRITLPNLSFRFLIAIVICNVLIKTATASNCGEVLFNQNIYHGSVYLLDQEDVDDFGSFGYTEIIGELKIFGSNISSIEALSTIEIVGDNFEMSNCVFTSEGGQFINLQSVGGSFVIRDSVLDFDNVILQNLQSVGEDFEIRSSSMSFGDNLFPSLQTIGGKILLQDCNSEAFNSLNALESIQESLKLKENNFAIINGFDNLISPNIDFEISGNNFLESFGSLNSIEDATKVLFYENNALTTIDGFSNLSVVSNEFELFVNPSLKFINGFNSLIAVGGSILISNSSIQYQNNYFSSLTSVEENLFLFDNFESQDMNSFNNLETVSGSLVINDINAPIISGFDNLISIGIDLIFSGTGFQEIDGFENLEAVQRDFTVHNTNDLLSITGINSLTTVNDIFKISYNESLVNISGLQSLYTVSGDFSISNNGSNIDFSNFATSLYYVGGEFMIDVNNFVEEICGFDNLLTITGDIIIINNSIATKVCGFNSLESVNSISFFSNTLLRDLEGFTSLTTLNGLGFGNNSRLREVVAFENLTHINDRLSISHNIMLNSLSFLRSVERIENYISIKRNYSLSMCSEFPICLYLSESDAHNIESNLAGCNSAEEVEGNCNLGIDEINKSALSIFPNPTKNHLTILSDATPIEFLTIRNYLGQIIRKTPYQANIYLSDLHPGVYFLEVQFDGGEVMTKKIIKD